jgi:hypothetical protein
LSVEETIIMAVLATIGSTAQGCTGIGFGLIAGPVLVAIDPDFAPGPLLLMALLISCRHVVVEWAHLDRPGLRSLFTGAPLGMAGGLVLLDTMSDRSLALLVGSIVTVAAVVVLAGVGPRRTRRTMLAGGAFTAFTGVTAGLPGPPISIMYHDAPPPVLRSSGSLFASLFAVVAVLLLVVFGEFGERELDLTLLLIPPTVVGLIVARYLRPMIDATVFRSVILVLAGLGGLGLILASL